jgi:hypothetical protein
MAFDETKAPCSFNGLHPVVSLDEDREEEANASEFVASNLEGDYAFVPGFGKPKGIFDLEEEQLAHTAEKSKEELIDL